MKKKVCDSEALPSAIADDIKALEFRNGKGFRKVTEEGYHRMGDNSLA